MLDLLSRCDVDELKVLLEVVVGLLKMLEGLCEFFLEFGSLEAGLFLELGGVEHVVVSNNNNY